MEQIWNYTQNLAEESAFKFFERWRFIKNAILLAYFSLRNFLYLFTNPIENMGKIILITRITLTQIYFTGHQSVGLVSFIAIITGSLAVLPVSQGLSILGQADMVGKILIMVILREVAPLFTAFVVIARSGTAVASELGNMQVNKEMDSLRAMGIDFPSYVIFPRVVGGIVSIICLNFYFNVMSFGGGYIVSNLIQPLSFSSYMSSIAHHIMPMDLLTTSLKCVGSAWLIFILSASWGLSVKKSSHEVPQVTSMAVVWCLASVMAWNLLVSIIGFVGMLL